MATEDSNQSSQTAKRQHSGDTCARAKEHPHYFISYFSDKLFFGCNPTFILLPSGVNVLASYSNLDEDK